MAPSEHPAEITPPAEPQTLERGRRGPGVWVWLVFGLVCAAGGAALTLTAMRMWTPAREASAVAVAPPGPIAAPAAEAAFEQSAQAEPPEGELGSHLTPMEQRLNGVESAQDRMLRAAALSLAVATLSQEAEGSAPFVEAVTRLERVLPASRDLSALRALAAQGAPSRAALAAGFDAAAARAIIAAKAPDRSQGLLARAKHALASVVVVRRVDSTAGAGPDALLARAGLLAREGDLQGALEAVSRLSPAGQSALAQWRAGAERRVEIDRRMADLRADALVDLAQAQGADG